MATLHRAAFRPQTVGRVLLGSLLTCTCKWKGYLGISAYHLCAAQSYVRPSKALLCTFPPSQSQLAMVACSQHLPLYSRFTESCWGRETAFQSIQTGWSLAIIQGTVDSLLNAGEAGLPNETEKPLRVKASFNTNSMPQSNFHKQAQPQTSNL